MSINLTRAEMISTLTTWMKDWNAHDLESVMALFDEDAIFIAWTGSQIASKRAIRYAWTSWFTNHQNFTFKVDEILVDEVAQKATISWTLTWPSQEPKYKGQIEQREGIDYLEFSNRLIVKKQTFSQTVLLINNESILLQAN